MATETVRLDWVDDQVFLLRDRGGFPIVVAETGGAHASDLLPLSLIGCATWDVISILRKQRQQVTGLQVSAQSVQDDEPPWRFRQIHVHYRVLGRGLKEDLVRRAIALSEDKYCSVYATLHEAVEITSDYEIVADEPKG